MSGTRRTRALLLPAIAIALGVLAAGCGGDGAGAGESEGLTGEAIRTEQSTTELENSEASPLGVEGADEPGSEGAGEVEEDTATGEATESDGSEGNSGDATTSTGSEATSDGSTSTDDGSTASTVSGAATTASSSGSAESQTTSTAAPTTASTAAPTTASSSTTVATGGLESCVVRLHGKSGSGGQTYVAGDGVKELWPNGNDEAWGGLQWLYFPEDRYQQVVGIVRTAVDAEGCGTIVLNGFSNGAAFAAKLYCRGESFGGRLRGVVIDDPVPDNGAAGCAPASGVDVAIYWTGDLARNATPGANCAAIDWTCDGGTMVGIDAYAAAVGTQPIASPFSDHRWYTDAPEIRAFLN